MTEAEASKKIMDSIYAAREQIYEETKHLAGKEYTAYFNDHAQAVIERSGYTAVLPFQVRLGIFVLWKYTIQCQSP